MSLWEPPPRILGRGALLGGQAGEAGLPIPGTTWTPMPVGERAPVLSCPRAPEGTGLTASFPQTSVCPLGGECGRELILDLPPIAWPADAVRPGGSSGGLQGGQAAGDSQGPAQPPEEATPALAGPVQHKCPQTPRPAKLLPQARQTPPRPARSLPGPRDPTPGLRDPSPGPRDPSPGLRDPRALEVAPRRWSAAGVSE